MAARVGISNAQLAAALRETFGNYLATAEKLKISRQVVRDRVERSPEMKRVIAEAEERLLDLAERRSAALINSSDGPQIRWYLDRKGRRRGYGPPNAAVTIEGGDGKSGVVVTVQINGADAEL